MKEGLYDCWFGKYILEYRVFYKMVFVCVFLMGDYLGELIDAFVVVYNAEAGHRDIVVCGGDDVSRERFIKGMRDRGLSVSDVGGVEGKYSIDLGYYLERGVLPELASLHHKLREPVEIKSLGVRVSVM